MGGDHSRWREAVSNSPAGACVPPGVACKDPETRHNSAHQFMSGIASRLIVCAAFLVCLAVVPSAASEVRRVVIVYDERTDLPGLQILDASLVQSLTSDAAGSIEVYREAMDLSRLDAPGYLPLLRDFLRAKYAGKTIDVVVAALGPSLDFVVGGSDPVFPGTPIVFCGIDRREIERRVLPPGVTGVILKREFAPTLDLALRFHPHTKRVVVVGGTSAFDARLLEQARGEFRPYEKSLTFTYLTTLSLRELLVQVASLPPHTIVLYTTLFRDGAGQGFVPHEVAEQVSAAANVPVYGFNDQFMGRGIVGGRLYSMAAHGKQAGALVRQILAGAPASDVPWSNGGAGVTVFDAKQLKRWGISENVLPADSTLHRQLTAWDHYRTPILVGALLILMQSAFIVALLVQRAGRRRVERALRESEERYAMASAAGAVGAWDWNLESGEIYVDPTLKSILGFEAAGDTMRVEQWGARVHPGDLPAVTAKTQACIAGTSEEYEAEHRMFHTDGSVRWFLSRGSISKRADGTPHRFVGTKVDITERKYAEAAIREKEAALRSSDRKIQHLAGRLIAAQEIERARIARDLHDDTSQQLAGLAIALSALKRRLAGLRDAASLREDVSSLQQRAVMVAENVRHLSHDLHPSALEHTGLVAALASYCTELRGRQVVEVTFSAEGEVESTDRTLALCLYRVAQEALRNVVAHAHARHVDVQVRADVHAVELMITDDGSGFDLARVRESGQGLGLISMNERVHMVGGAVTISTQLNRGTVLHVRVPAQRPLQSEVGETSERYATT